MTSANDVEHYRSIKPSVPRMERPRNSHSYYGHQHYTSRLSHQRGYLLLPCGRNEPHVSIWFDFLSGVCKNFLLIFFFFLSCGFFIFFFLLLHLSFLRCCSLELFPQTADMCGDGCHIVQTHRDLPCRVRSRLLASH